jgi:hypothetical protein
MVFYKILCSRSDFRMSRSDPWPGVRCHRRTPLGELRLSQEAIRCNATFIISIFPYENSIKRVKLIDWRVVSGLRWGARECLAQLSRELKRVKYHCHAIGFNSPEIEIIQQVPLSHSLWDNDWERVFYRLKNLVTTQTSLERESTEQKLSCWTFPDHITWFESKGSLSRRLPWMRSQTLREQSPH